ncbi:MAG: amidase [Hyphomicrobiaceae bacterium]
MNIAEYASYDGLGLAELVARREVTPKELAQTAAQAIARGNPLLNAVVEIYSDRIDELDDKNLGSGPFRGVPFLIKDVFGHEAGRTVEFGSRLCEGMTVETSTYFCEGLKEAGVNIIGRSHAPEYSMSATTESAMFGNCSNPWKQGYSAGGSSGGAQAAVTSGMVPIAHGSDIGGSIRIPASWCGGVGMKPSRGRVSLGPVIDENGWGYSVNLIQTKSVRDAAAMLDFVSRPRPGDPFVIPRPTESYRDLITTPMPRLRIGLVLSELVDVPVDSEVADAVCAVGRALADMGHEVEEAEADMGGGDVLAATTDLFFFAFDARLDGYAHRAGRPISAELLEPPILSLYDYAKLITPARFMEVLALLNVARRKLGQFYSRYDVWLSPTTARVAEAWGKYHLMKPGVTAHNICHELYREPVQFTIPHNIMGTPAISLPTAMHSSGVPIGVQVAGRPGEDHIPLQLGAELERAMPWADRVPPLHVSLM